MYVTEIGTGVRVPTTRSTNALAGVEQPSPSSGIRSAPKAMELAVAIPVIRNRQVSSPPSSRHRATLLPVTPERAVALPGGPRKCYWRDSRAVAKCTTIDAPCLPDDNRMGHRRLAPRIVSGWVIVPQDSRFRSCCPSDQDCSVTRHPPRLADCSFPGWRSDLIG